MFEIHEKVWKMDFVISREKMDVDIEILQKNCGSKVEFYLACCYYYRKVLSNYRVCLVNYKFRDLQKEIFFFKNLKQVPQVNFFYYSYLWEYSNAIAITGEPFKVDLIKKKINEVTSFLKKHLKIYQYKKLGLTNRDDYYFTRPKSDYSTIKNISTDILFTTPKDVLFGKCEAHEKYLEFLESELSKLVGLEENQGNSNFTWTGSKVDLTELLYALYLSGKINSGNLTLKELVQFFEKQFSIDLGDYHHTFLRLRDRSNPSKFLDFLKSSLLKRMEELDS